MNCFAIKFMREVKNISQAKLADLSEVSERTIRDIEAGRNTTPNRDTLNRICAVISPENPAAFWEACNDEVDYAYEKGLLDTICGQIQPALIPPINKLLNPKEQNAVSYVAACVCGYLRGGSDNAAIRDNAITIMDALSAIMQTVDLTANAVELEAFTRYLICDLITLANANGLPKGSVNEVHEIIRNLSESRISMGQVDRITAVRSAYFWLYDNWGYIKNESITYNILSHIAILCDCAKDTHEMRCYLFYAILKHFMALSTATEVA